MPTIFYKEPETGISYSLVVTTDEAIDISTSNPNKAQRICLPDTGGYIDFDGSGNAALTSPNGKHSYARSSDIVASAKESLLDENDV